VDEGGEIVGCFSEMRDGWHSYFDAALLSALIDSSLLMRQPMLAAAFALYGLRTLHRTLSSKRQQQLMACLQCHAPPPPQCVCLAGLALPWLLRVTPLALNAEARPRRANASSCSPSVFIFSPDEARKQKAAATAAAKEVVWVAGEKSAIEIEIANHLDADMRVEVTGLVTEPGGMLGISPLTVLLPSRTTAKHEVQCWPVTDVRDDADGKILLRGVAMSNNGFGCVHPVGSDGCVLETKLEVGCGLVELRDPQAWAHSLLGAERKGALPLPLQISLAPPLPLLVPEAGSQVAASCRPLLSGERAILPITLRNHGEVPVCSVEARTTSPETRS
jgi:hypothetical protein